MSAIGPQTWWARARSTLSKPEDGASLAVFRICFGVLLADEIIFKFRVGKIKELYAPTFNFKYHFFEWVGTPDKSTSYALHIALIALALLVALGAFYRVSAWLLCGLLSYYFLAERTLYINHIYLYCLLAGIMASAPANSMLSIDAHLGRVSPARRERTPRWSLWLLRFQMGVVYSYAGLAKLNSDWLQGSPLNLWLPARLGPDHWLLFDELPLLMSWGGAAFDLLVTPLLLWRKTRVFAFAWAAAFHLLNANIFGIASFPWMSLSLTTLFFDPSWPRQRLLNRARPPRRKRPPKAMGNFGLATLLSYVLVQVVLPMRPWFYPGTASWTEEGHEFSWHMMLRAKDGQPVFSLVFPDGSKRVADPLEHITKRQLSRVATRPDLIHQFALFLADEHESRGLGRPKVFVDVRLSYNGRPPVPLIDPNVDLAAEPRTLGAASWMMPAPSGPPARGLASKEAENYD